MGVTRFVSDAREKGGKKPPKRVEGGTGTYAAFWSDPGEKDHKEERGGLNVVGGLERVALLRRRGGAPTQKRRGARKSA